jgi:hypothetical protein
MSIATEQKKKNKKFLRLKHYKHFLLLVFWPVLLLWFFYCERSVVPKYIMHSRLMILYLLQVGLLSPMRSGMAIWRGDFCILVLRTRMILLNCVC